MRLTIWSVVLLGLLSSACSRIDPPASSGELVVALRPDPVFYQTGVTGNEARGIEYDLLDAFARDLQVRLRVVPAASEAELLQLVRDRKVHLAGAVPVTTEQPRILFSEALRETEHLLIQHAESLPREDPDSIAGHRIEVFAGSPQAAALRNLTIDPPAEIIETTSGDPFDLMARVARREIEMAAIDGVHFDVAVNYYPEVYAAQELPGKLAYAWAFHVDAAPLIEQARDFIARSRNNGTLSQLDDRYFGHIDRINSIGILQFLEDMRSRLPHYRALFHEAQLRHGLDWRLIAALAYQESRWDPLATSPTGVRGMLMLTEDTADRLRVGNRLDARQSVMAGTRYLVDLRNELPPDIKEPDRTWMALAAYNLGMGHMNGARSFAVDLRRDPASWYDMKKVLPLLARPEYYSRLKSGRARGGEAVIMVENIRIFQDILNRFEAPYVPVVKPR
jgi:membrane-bound lytic murein transglycosylase F